MEWSEAALSELTASELASPDDVCWEFLRPGVGFEDAAASAMMRQRSTEAM
jgi:hypothetical protein